MNRLNIEMVKQAMNSRFNSTNKAIIEQYQLRFFQQTDQT